MRVVLRPKYRDWADFLARTTLVERRGWCAKKTKVANRARLMSGVPETLVTVAEVLFVLERAEGRCLHCGSFAVERRPSNPATGAPLPWEHMGRRIGTLEHLKSRFDGGSNCADNLAWCCLWCNTWVTERRKGALDHGGYYPPLLGGRPARSEPASRPGRKPRRNR